MADRVPMTPRGAELLREQLKRLKEERPKISREIGVARDHGDLSENAEYHAAKERQGMVEAKIKDIEGKLSVAEIIDPKTLSGPMVRFGARVALLNLETEEPLAYQLVGADEADLKAGLLSIASPLARALVGKEEGDTVTVVTPTGQREYEITSVEYR